MLKETGTLHPTIYANVGRHIVNRTHFHLAANIIQT